MEVQKGQDLTGLNATWQYDDSGTSKFFKMAERSNGYSGETLMVMVPCARKKKLQGKTTKDFYRICAEEKKWHVQ